MQELWLGQWYVLNLINTTMLIDGPQPPFLSRRFTVVCLGLLLLSVIIRAANGESRVKLPTAALQRMVCSTSRLPVTDKLACGL